MMSLVADRSAAALGVRKTRPRSLWFLKEKVFEKLFSA
jgi:hypothetical protein